MNATAYIHFSLPAVQHASLSSRLRLDIDLLHRDTNLGYRRSILGPTQFHLAHSTMALSNLSRQTYSSNFILKSSLLSLLLYMEISSATTVQSPLPPTTPSKQNTKIPNNANVLHTCMRESSPSDIQVLPVHALQHRHLLDQYGFFSDWLV